VKGSTEMAEEFNQEVIGAIGRVTVPIEDGRAGEVMLPVRGGVEAYSALADEDIAKYARVVVVEVVSGRTVLVTTC
jgi:membrane protein implicated in regulation of membrane protease activity